MPVFSKAVTGLDDIVRTAPQPPGRYSVLSDVPATMTNVGHPGYSNAATDEVLSKGIVSKMFAAAATGALSPEDAMAEASSSIEPIFVKWQQAGKI